MDTLTHALSGALLAYAARPSRVETDELPLRTRLIAGFAAAFFPDLDFVLRIVDTLTYLNWHQGPTHSLLMLPIWAFLLAHLFSWAARRAYSWRAFFMPACLGIAIHIAGDLITSYGLMLFAPFSFQRFSLSLAFVIDPWLSILIVIGLVVSLKFPQRRIITVLVLIGLLGYVAWLWVLHERARQVGLDFAKTISTHTEVSVLPQPLSPLNWKVIVEDGVNYHVTLINLGRNKNTIFRDSGPGFLHKLAAHYKHFTEADWQYLPLFGGSFADTALVRTAWSQPEFSGFRQFAVFPLLDQIEHSEKEACFWFFDLRFSFPTLPSSFRYGMCRNNDTFEWRMRRHKGESWIDWF